MNLCLVSSAFVCPILRRDHLLGLTAYLSVDYCKLRGVAYRTSSLTFLFMDLCMLDINTTFIHDNSTPYNFVLYITISSVRRHRKSFVSGHTVLRLTLSFDDTLGSVIDQLVGSLSST